MGGLVDAANIALTDGGVRGSIPPGLLRISTGNYPPSTRYPLRLDALPYSRCRRKSSVRQVSTAIPQKNSHITPSKVGTHIPDDHSANAPR